MSSTRICIIRHGETDWNAERRIQGQIDIPLNARGQAQAHAAAQGLAGQQFAALYSSDLQRAHETASALAAPLGLLLRTDPGLRERHYGMFQGATQSENQTRHPAAYACYLARDPDFGFETGESLRAFACRVIDTLERLAARHAGQTLLLVAHGGVLDIIYRQACGTSLSTPRDFPIPNAALNWIEIAPTGWHMLSWAENSHLQTTQEVAVE